MGTTYRFLATGDEVDAALDWFLRQPDPPEVTEKPYGHLLYFRGMGPLARTPDGSGIDVGRSPLVSLFRPSRRRGVLWTTGEAHFLTTPLRQGWPALHALALRFNKWLSSFDLVFAGNPSSPGDWNYYLEGSIRNHAEPVYALPLATRALGEGQYFVGWSDNDAVLNTLCRSLRHRGVECIPDDKSRATDAGLSNA